jgi:hypothetical protein
MSKIEMTGKLKKGITFNPNDNGHYERASTTIDRSVHTAIKYFAKSKNKSTGEMIDIMLKYAMMKMIEGD